MRADYSRLPQALLPVITFMAAAALAQTSGLYLFRTNDSADISMLFSTVCILVLVIVFRLLYGPVFLTDPAVFRKHSTAGRSIAVSAGTGLVLFAGVLSAACALNILAALVFPGALTDNAGGRGSLTVLLACGCAVVPACEELIFRCHLFPVLLRLKPPLTGVIICSLLFGVYHEDLVQGIYAFAMGCFLCIAWLTRDGFKSSFLTHAGVNLVMILLSRSGLFTKMVFPAAAAATAGISAVCIYTYFSLRRVLHL